MQPSILLAATALFIGVMYLAYAENVQDCPMHFQRYSSSHSYCQPPNSSCEILAYYPTNEDITNIIDLHNKYRSVMATGQESLPPAANMMQIEWDDELAAVAQKYTDQCIYEHDCPNCRRVMNFGVGQNIAIQKLTGSHTVPQPDWHFAMSEWYSEIVYFQQNNICPFNPPNGGGEFRHFSQLVWAESFRVGCGYVLYKTGRAFVDEAFVRLYICDYGVAGNIYGTCVYEAGEPCSHCPQNSCCGNDCGGDKNYPGLCKRTDNNAPYYPLKVPHLFHCDFRNTSDCDSYIIGNPGWTVEPTLSGNYLGIVLDGGQNSSIVFKNSIVPNEDHFCITLKYRKGPNKDGNEQINTAEEVFFVPSINYTVSQPLQGYENPARQQFSTYNMTLSWNKPTTFKLSFSVPNGAPSQFFNVAQITASDGRCQNVNKK